MEPREDENDCSKRKSVPFKTDFFDMNKPLKRVSSRSMIHSMVFAKPDRTEVELKREANSLRITMFDQILISFSKPQSN